MICLSFVPIMWPPLHLSSMGADTVIRGGAGADPEAVSGKFGSPMIAMELNALTVHAVAPGA